MTDFGASFKKARQAKKITLDQIAQETRISTRLLQAIENEEFHLLPGGIFNRGFVRMYAECVGIDPNQAVTDYERVAQIQESSEAVRTSSSAPSEKNNRHLFPIALGALILLILLYYIVSREIGSKAETAGETAVVSLPVAPAKPLPSPPLALPEPVVTPPPTAPTPAAVPVQPLVVEMQARQTTWFRVSTDGVPATPADGETLEPGATRRFTAQDSIDLAIGNAGGVTIQINGHEARPMGNSGQVRVLQITPQNFRDFVR